MKRGLNKKGIAWILTFVMVFGLLMVPTQTIQAQTVTNPTDTKESVYVSFDLETDKCTNDYNQYAVNVHNNSGGTICDWEVNIVFNNDPGWNAGWNGASYDATSKTITIQTYGETSWTNATIYNGQVGSGAGFQIDAGMLEQAQVTLTYSNGESSEGPATGGNTGGDLGDGTFDGDNIGEIDTSLDYNFAKLLQYSLYFYDANMCGDQVSETSLYSKELYNGWRGDCHVNDAFTYGGKKYSAVGGFHDAGDHVKFGVPLSVSMTTLGLGCYEFRDAYDALGQTKHLKTITDYYCDYVRNCTVLNESNKVEAFCYQVGCGQKDHESWVAPEVENETATNRTYTLVATVSNPATDVVSETAAALTINYLNFGNEEDLKYAKALFAFAMENNKSIGEIDASGSFYGSSSWRDDYCLAAALLYKATKDSVYATEYNKENGNSGNLQKPYGWDNVYQAAALYAPNSNSTELSTINNYFDSVASKSANSYFCDDKWGSARINCNVQLMMMIYDKHNNSEKYKNWAKYQMSMILGNNSINRNLVCGYNVNSPTKPHHRAASGYSGWNEFNNNATQKYTLYGALVGGPTSSDFSTYKDVVNDAITNEVTTDYNAGMVGASAALYLAFKDSTEEGFDNQAINEDFYGGSRFEGNEEPEQPEEPTPAAELNVSKNTLQCSNLVYGYTEGSATSITVSNEGDAATTSYSASLEKGTAFEMTDGALVQLFPGDRDGIAVTVKGKLGAGTYQDNLIITYNGSKKITIPVSVTVAKKTITVTAENKVKEYGDENPKLTVSNAYEASLVPGDSLVYTLSTAATSDSEVGAYPIQLTVAEDPNYDVVTQAATLTITKKTVGTVQFPVASTITLEQTLSDSALSGGSTEYGSFAWKYEDTELTKGTHDYDVVLTLNNHAIKNYDFSNIEGYDSVSGTITRGVSVNVLRADLPVIVFPTSKSITYGQMLNNAIFTGGSTQYGTFKWENPSYTPTIADIENGVIQANMIFTWNAASKNEYALEDNEMTITQVVNVPVHKQENANYAETPLLTNRTASSIQVTEIAGVEYSLDEMSWQTSGTFMHLSPFTSYEVYAREAETATHYPGEICVTPLSVYTLVTDPYTIDVSKLAGDEADAYVDALRVDASEEPTVTYADNMLTLKDKDVTYTLTGKNENLIVQVDAENVTINVQGETTLKAIVSECEGALVLTGNGTRKVEYIDVTNELIIRDTTVIADARQSEHAAIKAGMVTIENSNVEATSKTGSAIVSDDIILIGKNQVTTLGKDEDLYASVPKDENGDVAKIFVSRIVLDMTELTLEVGEEEILQETVLPSNAHDKTVSWSSSNPAVVTVTADGEVKAVAPGTASITVAAKDGSGVTAACEVAVITAESDVVCAKSIKVTGPTKKVAPGKKVKLQATVYPENAVNQEVKWKVNNRKYATVNSAGVVKTKKAGKGKKVVVTAYLADDSSIKATYTISIMKNAVKKIKLSAKTMTLKKGKSVKVKAKFTPSKGISKELTWTSSNKKVAVVNAKGKVTAKKKGTAKITAKAKDGTGKKATIRIRVR